MARLVYKGEKIKEYAGGYVFTRNVPRDVAIEKLDDLSRHQIESNKDITEASKSAKPGPTDVELVLDTPGYEPPAGHDMPRLTRKATKKRSKRK